MKGKGCHAAEPHRTMDPAIIAAQIVLGLQTLVSRRADRWSTGDFCHKVECRTSLQHHSRNPPFDFNDEALPRGIGYWVKLVEAALTI
ncbi:hypothetical protein [Mesorhizobium sp. M0633]|uniref:hypothetical protein n=1 Tax=Mesorhizobium sp. M0633 TaxID=2956977 RepID=UPI003336BF0A